MIPKEIGENWDKAIDKIRYLARELEDVPVISEMVLCYRDNDLTVDEIIKTIRIEISFIKEQTNDSINEFKKVINYLKEHKDEIAL